MYVTDTMPSYVGLSKTFCRTPLSTYAVWGAIVTGGCIFFNEVEQNERDRCSKFRDRSQMFGGKVKEGDAPSWGRPYKPLI